MEFSLINLIDNDSLRESVKMLTSKEIFNDQIKMYENNGTNENNTMVPNISGTQKWVGVDDDGEKCLYYTIGSNSETKNFGYKHFQQLEMILLELVNFVEQM